MKEGELSTQLYSAAEETFAAAVISWQGTGGKRYTTRKVMIRLPNTKRMLPDLVMELDDTIWIIEIKGSHADALREDEPKLEELRTALPPSRVLRFVELHGGHTVRPGMTVGYAVAYSAGEAGPTCLPGIVHIPWEDMLRRGESLAERLRAGA